MLDYSETTSLCRGLLVVADADVKNAISAHLHNALRMYCLQKDNDLV